ncbi:MAG: hypothetical protein OXQ29_20710 [Rhodospirillaceae bacterium]|nr:hypothetical protein [Rhodospirillaceae bacterium]
MTPQEIESLVRRYADNLTARENADAALSKAQGLVHMEFPRVQGESRDIRWWWDVFWRSFDHDRLVALLADVKAAQLEVLRLNAETEGIEECLKTQGLAELIRKAD